MNRLLLLALLVVSGPSETALAEGMADPADVFSRPAPPKPPYFAVDTCTGFNCSKIGETPDPSRPGDPICVIPDSLLPRNGKPLSPVLLAICEHGRERLKEMRLPATSR